MAQQTYAERAAAAGTVATFNGADLIRVQEALISATDFIARIKVLGALLSGNVITSPNDDTPALTVKSFDATPDANSYPLRVENSAGSLLAAIHSAFVASTAGYVSAKNVLPNAVYVTANQVEPPGIVTDDFWIRPKA